MKLMSIASGSSGNCIYVGTDSTSLLVDAGISKKKISEGLDSIDMDFRDIDGILITHEHIDHVRSLGVIARSYDIPIYATKETCQAIGEMSVLGEYNKELFHYIDADKSFNIGDITVEAHSVWHDAADPVCYTMTSNGKKVSIATDLGDYDDYIVNAIKDSDALLIEANHDVRMLQVGPYPYSTKQRILGKRGHLSNEKSGKLLLDVLNSHIKGVFLGHLSKDNNYPELAYETVKTEISGNPFSSGIRDFNIKVASRVSCSDLIHVWFYYIYIIF